MRRTAAAAVAVLKPGVDRPHPILPGASDWCQVQAGDYRGYLKRSQFWGALPGEVVTN